MVVYFLQLAHMSTRGDQTRLVTVLTIKLTFSTVETHQVYAVNNMEPLTLSCLWNGHINLMFVNGVDQSNIDYLHHGYI